MTKLSELKTPPCQQILDEQGYLILAGYRDYRKGEVIPSAQGGDTYSKIPGPLVIIGNASREEWVQQHVRFIGSRPAFRSFRPSHFHRVIAE